MPGVTYVGPRYPAVLVTGFLRSWYIFWRKEPVGPRITVDQYRKKEEGRTWVTSGIKQGKRVRNFIPIPETTAREIRKS